MTSLLSQPNLKIAASLGCLLIFLSACTPALSMPATAPSLPVTVSPKPVSTGIMVPSSAAPLASATPLAVEFSPTPVSSPSPLPPDFWKSLPVIPAQVSPRVRTIYQQGLSMGNQAHIFSRIGDCASAAPAFLVGFDRNYNLGQYTSLQPAIDYFKGAFDRPSLAAKAGLNSAGLLTTLWTGEQCRKNESLLDCQYRLDRPSFAFIDIGTNEAYYVHTNPGSFERNMRIILDDTIAKGIVPVLGTKADNIEGDESINASIARLAVEYQIPLWNFWRAVQPLPEHGLVDPDHLSSVSYANFVDFSMTNSQEYGVQVRNLTALQMLEFLRKQLADVP